MRKEQEEVLMEAHRSGRIQATLLRLPDFYGPRVEASFFGGLFSAIRSGKRAQMIGPIDVPHEYVYVPMWVPSSSSWPKPPRPTGAPGTSAVPGTIIPRAFAQRAFAKAGQKPRLLVANKFMLRLMGLFNPFLRELVEMHYLITTPVVVDDRALESLIGPLKKTSYDEGIDACLRAIEVT
ncbi:MAG: hypothetical protein WDN28_32980 [Chthoniobacter sp.]